MGLTMRKKKSVTKVTAKRYCNAGKKEKGKIINEFIKLTNAPSSRLGQGMYRSVTVRGPACNVSLMLTR